MPRRELQKPAIVSWPTWKFLLLALFAGGSITSLSWLFKAFWEPDRYIGFGSNPPSFPPLTIGDILLGSGLLLIPFWKRWAWQPRRKHARWNRWLAELIGAVYVCVLVLLGGTASWNILLRSPWNWVVNSALVVFLIMAWILPALSYRWSKKIARVQDTFSLRMLAYGGVESLMVLAGILGASYGMNIARNGDMRWGLLAIGFLFSLLAVSLAQYNAEHLWRYRPWAKEEE